MKNKEILMEESPLIGAFWILSSLGINGSTCHYDDPVCSITLPFLGGFASYNKEHKNIWAYYNDGFENFEWNYLPRGRVAYHIHLIQIGEEFEKNNQVISNIRKF